MNQSVTLVANVYHVVYFFLSVKSHYINNELKTKGSALWNNNMLPPIFNSLEIYLIHVGDNSYGRFLPLS